MLNNSGTLSEDFPTWICPLKNLLFLTILVFYNHHDTGHTQKGHLQDPNEVILSLPWLQTVSKE